MKKMRNEHSVETMSDKLILEKVLGRSSVRLFGWGRDPLVDGNTSRSSKKSKRPTYDEVVDELETLKGKYATMEKILIEKNIMPPHGDTSEFGTSNHTPSGQSRDDFSENFDRYDDME